MKKVISLIATSLFVFSCAPTNAATESSVSTPAAPINHDDSSPNVGPIAADGSTKLGVKFSRVIYLVFENEDQKNVISNAYFKDLASRGANFTNMTAEIHPSQGNYIAMVAGDPYGINHDGNVDLNVPHLGDLLEAKNKTWKMYAEGFPSGCYTGSRSGKYARKHAPFMSFVNVSKNSKRCANITNEKSFFADWKAGTLPNFSMYIPDLNNDGHDTSVDYSAKWLKKNFDSAFNDSAMMKDTLVVLTYDESSYSGGNKIYNVLLGSSIKPGSVISASHSHSSILRMIEDEFQLGSLNRGDAKATAITNVWK